MTSILSYVGRRFLQFLIVVWIAGSINFIVPRLMPGDPLTGVLARKAAAGGGQSLDAARLKEVWDKRFGFDEPILEQYLDYWQSTLRGDLGISVAFFPDPVVERIAAALPWSIGLLLTATLIAFAFGSILGALLVWPRAPRLTALLAGPMLLLATVPYYLLAILLLYIFAVALRIFPPAGGFSPTLIVGFNLQTATDIAAHAVLPALSIVLAAAGFWALGMRSLMVNVLGEDYITYAESKGLSARRVFLRYGMRNAMLPQVTALALALATVVSGAVLVEAIFSYPGLGGILFSAVTNKDVFVINGIGFVLILTVATAVLIIDLVYPLLDPRIRHQR